MSRRRKRSWRRRARSSIDVGVGRAQFEHAIAVLIGETPAMVSIPETIVNAPPPVIPLGVPSTLMERRPDITATERAIAAANEQIGIAKAAYFPMLTLSGTGGFVCDQPGASC